MRYRLVTLILLLSCLALGLAQAGLDEKQIIVMLSSGYKSSEIEGLIRHNGYTGRRDPATLLLLKQNGASLELVDLISYDLKLEYPLVASDVRAMLLNKATIGQIAAEIDARGFQGRLSSAEALDLITYGATPDLIKILQKRGEETLHAPDQAFLLIGLKPQLVDGSVSFEQGGYGTASRRMLIRPEWEEANFFHSGLARVHAGNAYGYIDKNGLLAIPAKFTLARDFSEGIAVVSLSSSGEPAYRFITKDGELLAKEFWESAGDFKEGLARVGDRGKCGFIGPDGKMVIPPQWSEAGDFCQGLAWVKTSADTESTAYGFINPKGEMTIPPTWDAVQDFSEGLAAVKKNGLWGYIDRKGKTVIESKYKEARSFSENVAAVRVDYLSLDKWVYINYAGELAINGTWLEAADYHKGLAQVADSTGKMVINKSGNRELPLGWTLARNQPAADVVLVTHEKLTKGIEAAYMDLSGRIIWRSE